jgi:phosphoribosylformylglycinamidine synthase
MPREADITRDDALLYAETASRFVVTVPPPHRQAFCEALHGYAIGDLGYVLDTAQFRVTGLRGEVIITSDIAALKEAWQRPLRW